MAIESDTQATVERTVHAAMASIGAAGDWLTADQRLAAWHEVRDARSNELDAARAAAISPNAVPGGHTANGELSAPAVEVLHRISSDPGRLSRTWADQMIEALGEETYVELVGVAAIASTLDLFFWAMHGEDVPLPAADQTTGPANHRPDDVGEVGAWVAQSTGVSMANVSRSLSLVPVTNKTWVSLVQAMYSRGPEFLDLEWERPLSRPQVELVAARTTAENECFY